MLEFVATMPSIPFVLAVLGAWALDRLDIGSRSVRSITVAEPRQAGDEECNFLLYANRRTPSKWRQHFCKFGK